MTETLAVVRSISGDGLAVCEQGVRGICGSCSDRTASCPDDRTDSSKKPVIFSVPNSLNAGVVRIGVPESSVMVSAVIAYLVPLLGLLAGALVFELIFQNDLAGIAGAFAGLTLGFCLAIFLSRIFVKTIWAPRMVGILPAVPGCKTDVKS